MAQSYENEHSACTKIGGYLVFQRSNASGLPENDRAFRLPVLFPPK
ncbi:MAG: hypothetical protein NXI25_09270 [bacterium]|jgi:hypothetical protein|nr:hypothetical protein [bacterium]